MTLRDHVFSSVRQLTWSFVHSVARFQESDGFGAHLKEHTVKVGDGESRGKNAQFLLEGFFPQFHGNRRQSCLELWDKDHNDSQKRYYK